MKNDISPMRQISLPTDVLDHIFSFLESDTTTLETCTLSHPFLSQFAQRYLYSTIDLEHGVYDTWRRMFEFNQLLLDTPRIGGYVRTVEVRINDNPRQDLSLFSSILQKLPLVKKITLIQVDRRGEISWEVLPETFRQAFLKCLRLPTMKELYVEYIINFPLSALRDSKTIKILELVDWKYNSKIKVPGDTLVHPFPPIESLSIFDCENQSVRKMLPRLEKCHIHSLSFSLGFANKHDFDVMADLLACSSNYLTTLNLHVEHILSDTVYNLTTGEVRHDDTPIPITLSALVHLENLTIYGTVHIKCLLANEWTMTTSIPAITNVLKTSPSLKRVSLSLFFIIINFQNFPIGLANWAPLVRFFSESSVSSFNLHIKTPGSQCTTILTSLANCADLMKLVDKGVLVITPQIPGERKVSQCA